MTGRIRVQRFIFFESPEDAKRHGVPGADGVVYYEILIPCSCSPACEIACPDHPKDHHHYERQPFSLHGRVRHRLDATPEEIADDRANIWAWDGSREAPSLTPSYLGFKNRPYRVHLFLQGGTISLCPDSTVTLA